MLIRNACKRAAVSLMATLLISALNAQPASVLLQKGIYAEETEGDLKSAIDLYRQISPGRCELRTKTPK